MAPEPAAPLAPAALAEAPAAPEINAPAVAPEPAVPLAPAALAEAPAAAPGTQQWVAGDIVLTSCRQRPTYHNKHGIVVGSRGKGALELKVQVLEGPILGYAEQKQKLWILARQCTKVALPAGMGEAAAEQSSAVRNNPAVMAALEEWQPPKAATTRASPSEVAVKSERHSPKKPSKGRGFLAMAKLFQKCDDDVPSD